MIKDLKIFQNTTIEVALKKLHSIEKKTLLVSNNKNKLLGTLSDGDIRRGLIKGLDLNHKITKLFNKKPTFFYENKFDNSVLKKTFMENREFDFVPIIDKFKKIKKIVFWEDIFPLKVKETEFLKKDLKCVIMAGGLGTRLEPFTKILPKPLIPVKNKTLIEYVINYFCKNKINKFLISTNYKSEIIKSYFSEIKKDYTLKFFKEKKPLGTIGGLGLMKSQLKKTFIVSNVDTLIDTDLSDFYNFHTKHKNDLTLIASAKKYVIPYGNCIPTKNGSLKRISEKPSISMLINVGVYICEPSILKFLEKNKRIDMNEFIEILKKKKRKIGIYPIGEEKWKDLGQWIEYRSAVEKL